MARLTGAGDPAQHSARHTARAESNRTRSAVKPVVGRIALLLVRWWFGIGSLIAGVGSVIAAPIRLARGDWGGFYYFLGGVMFSAFAWLVHPLGRSWWHRRGNANAS